MPDRPQCMHRGARHILDGRSRKIVCTVKRFPLHNLLTKTVMMRPMMENVLLRIIVVADKVTVDVVADKVTEECL